MFKIVTTVALSKMSIVFIDEKTDREIEILIDRNKSNIKYHPDDWIIGLRIWQEFNRLPKNATYDEIFKHLWKKYGQH